MPLPVQYYSKSRLCIRYLPSAITKGGDEDSGNHLYLHSRGWGPRRTLDAGHVPGRWSHDLGILSWTPKGSTRPGRASVGMGY